MSLDIDWHVTVCQDWYRSKNPLSLGRGSSMLKDIHYHSQNKIDASVIIKKDNEINKDITLNKENNEIIIKLDSKDERE